MEVSSLNADTGTIRLLLEHGAKVNVRANDGSAALHFLLKCHRNASVIDVRGLFEDRCPYLADRRRFLNYQETSETEIVQILLDKVRL